MASQKFFQSNLDPTKELQLDVDGISTATARTWTVPDQDIDWGIAGLTAATIDPSDLLIIRDATDGLLKKISASDVLVTNPLVFKGGWDASTGTFPGGGSAQTGHLYVVTTGGTVDGVSFSVGDTVYSQTNNASTTTFTNNWVKVDSSDSVTSVFGRTGAVTAQAGDYNASQITNSPAGSITSVTVQGALNELDTKKVSNTLSSGRIFVGNGSNIATPVAMSGDVTIDNAGATTVVSASDTVAGKVELATSTEVATGTATNLAVTPAGLAANYTLTSDLGSTALNKGASLIGVHDAANNFTSTDLEGVLAELAGMSGGGNASTTAKGVIELATTTEIASASPPATGGSGAALVPTAQQIAFHMDATGTQWALRGVAASPTSTGWSTSNVTSKKTLDANSETLQSLADFVGTLAQELLAKGIIAP